MDNPQKSDLERWKIATLLIAPILVWAAYWFICTLALPLGQHSSEWRAQFGAMFGGVSALFSAYTFAGLIYTILVQRREISRQRDQSRQDKIEEANARSNSQKATSAQIEIAALTAILNASQFLLERSRTAQHTAMYEDDLRQTHKRLKTLLEESKIPNEVTEHGSNPVRS